MSTLIVHDIETQCTLRNADDYTIIVSYSNDLGNLAQLDYTHQWILFCINPITQHGAKPSLSKWIGTLLIGCQWPNFSCTLRHFRYLPSSGWRKFPSKALEIYYPLFYIHVYIFIYLWYQGKIPALNLCWILYNFIDLNHDAPPPHPPLSPLPVQGEETQLLQSRSITKLLHPRQHPGESPIHTLHRYQILPKYLGDQNCAECSTYVL